MAKASNDGTRENSQPVMFLEDLKSIGSYHILWRPFLALISDADTSLFFTGQQNSDKTLNF
jgi:hypothetical protein